MQYGIDPDPACLTPPTPSKPVQWRKPCNGACTSCNGRPPACSPLSPLLVLSVREPRTARTKPVQSRKPCNGTWDPDPACRTPPTPSYPNQCNGVICAMAVGARTFS